MLLHSINNSPGSIPVPSALNSSTFEAVMKAMARHAASPAVATAGCGALANALDLDRVTAGRVSRAVLPGVHSSAQKRQTGDRRTRPLAHAHITMHVQNVHQEPQETQQRQQQQDGVDGKEENENDDEEDQADEQGAGGSDHVQQVSISALLTSLLLPVSYTHLTLPTNREV